MVAKPVTVGIVGVIVLTSALVLNYFVLPGEETEIATPAPKPSAPKPSAPGPSAPGPSAPSVATTKSSAAAGKTTADTGTNTSAKTPAEATAAATAPAPRRELPSTPSFDLVRVDPEGNAVIAGRGAPNSEIAIVDGDEEIGRVVTDDRGEWVFVPPAKLAPGERVLMLRGLGSGGEESSEYVVLVIPERGKDIAGRPSAEPSVPLAMVVPRTADGSASASGARVLQAPAAGPLADAGQQATAGGSTGGAIGAQTGTVADSGTAKPAAPVPPSTSAAGSTAVGGSAGAVATPSATTGTGTMPGDAPPTLAGGAGPSAVTPSASTEVASVAPAATAFPEPASQEQKTATDKSNGVAVDVIDYDAKGEVVFSGRSEPGTTVEVYIDNQKVGDTSANAEGRWKMQPADPVPPGSYQLRVDKLAPSGGVAARVAFPFVRANPLTELPRGRLVVIQPGNNLWRIATRVYGSGERFIDIFDANQDQILNPDLIFPGQVFGLPRVN